MRRFFVRLGNAVWGRSAEREAAREIDAHLALLAEDFERRGLSPGEARMAARRSYGGVEQVKELHREARSFLWLEEFLQDLRYGARGLWSKPGFTAIAVITLALGIGANTAVFGVVKAVLLEPLGYRDAGRLVTILHNARHPVSAANYVDWRDQSGSFEALAAAEYWTPNLTETEQPERLVALHVTQNLLPMLGVEPLLGRVFTAGEDQPGEDLKVVLSHRLWQRRFGGDRSVLGRTIRLNGRPHTVVGVMPAGFKFAPFWATRAELWAPLALGGRLEARGANSLRVFARLKPGVSLEQARADIATVTAHLERQYPATNQDVVVTPLKQNVAGDVEQPLLLMMGAVGFVLLIACANVAHMLLARASERQREIAVRTALGAGRARVVRQFLTESLLLASLGAAGGLLLALWGTKALVALSPASIPRVDAVAIDARVVIFLLGTTLLTALVFGLAPAMHAAAGDLAGALKEGGRGGGGGTRHSRLRGFLVASEFALAFVLSIGAGLLIRSFIALQSVDPGFRTPGVLSMVVSVAGSKAEEPNQRISFYRQLSERVRAIPGVESAGAINHLPLAGDVWRWRFMIEGRPTPRPDEWPGAVYRVAMPGYFETMRIPIRRGRGITEDDRQGRPGIVVINERAASAFWPGADPLGQRIAFGDGPSGSPDWLTVVGVVANAKQEAWAEQPDAEVYLAAMQNRAFLGFDGSRTASITLVIRTRGNPAELVSGVKQTVWSLDRNLAISDVTTMDQVVADETAQPRFEMLLLGAFSVVALLLAGVGIYGVMNYSVSQRRHEIGIRVALGASRSDILRMVLRQGVVHSLAGAAAGAAGALLLSGLLARMLYAVRPADPVTFTGVSVVLGLGALIAMGVPAHKALRVEPIAALRQE